MFKKGYVTFEKLGEILRTRSDYQSGEFDQINGEISVLKSEIDKLKYPMGRIVRRYWCLNQFRLEYKYYNKQHSITGMTNKNITGYRKKGDYVEIQWVEADETEEITTYSTRLQLFLLKDELIPLDATVDFGDIEFQEVE